MPTAAPTAAPPNFYDNLPAGGDAAATSPASKKPKTDDAAEDLMLGFAGVIKVLKKMAVVNKDLKPGIDEIKNKIKEMVVQVLKKDPTELETGDDSSKTSEPPAAAPPTTTDETHTA